MGSLALPSAGLIYLDASSLIYSVERVEPYRTQLQPMWQEAQDGKLTIVSSPVLAIEALVKPLRDANKEIETQYRELFRTNAVRLLEAPYEVFEDAVRLRTRISVLTPVCDGAILAGLAVALVSSILNVVSFAFRIAIAFLAMNATQVNPPPVLCPVK